MALGDYSTQGEMFGPSPNLLIPAAHLVRAPDDLDEQLRLERLNGMMTVSRRRPRVSIAEPRML